jgi:polyisoprenyl-teichoic acid--peptidoglycan teichoic acid transferase
LATVEPPLDDGYQDDANSYTYHRRGVNTRLVIGIGIFAVLSLYVSLIAVTRVDGVLFPGNEIGLPVVGGVVPLIRGQNDQASATSIDQRINILVMGLDQRLDEPNDQSYRTDSMMVLTIDPYSKTAGAFSIPRDSRVDIPDGHGGVYMQTRINEAYEMGQYGVNGFPLGYHGGGPQLAMDTIKQNFGIPINYYVILNWANFIQIVDDLGGIDVTIPEYAYDPAYSTCQFCADYYPVEFIPGTEHMNGDRALEYARIRKSDNDFKRIERQQIVLRAIIAKAKTLNLLDIGKMKDIYTTYRDSIKTDIPDTQIPGLGLLVQQIDAHQGLANLRMVSMGPATYPCPAVECGDAAELDWYPQQVALLKAQVFSDVQLSTDNASVSVLNATNTPSLATDFSTQLKANGIPPANITVDEYANGLLYPTTLVVNVSGGNDHTISQIQGWLGIPDSQVLAAADPRAAQFLATTANVVVVLGADATEAASGDVSVTPQTGG